MRRFWPLLCLLLCSPGSVFAHPQFALSTVNRYTRLLLLPRRALLDYSLMVGEVPAERIKRQADLDHNGELSVTEQKQLAASLQATVERDVSVHVDGQRVRLQLVMQPLTFKSPKVEAAPFALEFSTELAIPSGQTPHTIVLDDRADIPPVGEVELRIEEGPDVELLAAESGSVDPQPKGTTPTSQTSSTIPMLFRQFGPPRSMLSDRSVTLRFAERKPNVVPSRRTSTYGIGILALLALCGLGLFARRFLRS